MYLEYRSLCVATHVFIRVIVRSLLCKPNELSGWMVLYHGASLFIPHHQGKGKRKVGGGGVKATVKGVKDEMEKLTNLLKQDNPIKC